MTKCKLTDDQQVNKDWLYTLKDGQVRALACQRKTQAPWQATELRTLVAELCRDQAVTPIREGMKGRA